MTSNGLNGTVDATTLGEANKKFERDGFGGQFAAVEGAEVICYTCHVRSPAGEVELDDLIRIEGVSDPDDMIAVAAILCPNCHTKGTLVLKYGQDSSLEDADVLRELQDLRGSNRMSSKRSRF